MWTRRRRRKEAEPLTAVRALHLPREDFPERPRSHQVTAAEVVECFTVRGGPAHQRSRRTRRTATTASKSYPRRHRKVASAERTPAELDRRLPIRRRQIGRESEIASAGCVPPPAVAVAKRIVPAVVVRPRELRSRRGATTMGGPRRPPSGSTSSRVSFWAAFPGSSGCGGSSRNAATHLLSRRTRTGRTRSSSGSSWTLRSSSPSRSGLPT